jgi:GT2 family glycosyltransferase
VTLDISVILPALGRPDAVENALASLRAQTLESTSFEVLLVDDGSHPPLAEVLCAESLDNVTVIRLDKNGGPAAARNVALKRAQGRITVLLNSDGVLYKDALAQHLAHHTEDTSPKSVMGRFDWLESQQTPFVRLLLRTEALFPYHVLPAYEPLSPRCFWTGNLSLPTDTLRKAGGFEEGFRHAIWEDVELGHRLEAMGIPLILDPDIHCHHDHPFDLDAYIRRSWLMGYYWGAFSEKHGPDALPLMGQPTLATPEVGWEMLEGLLHMRSECDALIETLDRMDGRPETNPTGQASPDTNAHALEMVTTFETMRGVVSYAFGLAPEAIHEEASTLGDVALIQFSAQYEPELMAQFAAEVPPGVTCLWATPDHVLPKDAGVEGAELIRVPKDLPSKDLWKPILSCSKAGMFVFLDGSRPPTETVIKRLRGFLALSPMVGGVGLNPSVSDCPRASLELPPAGYLRATKRIHLTTDQPGTGTLFERLRDRGLAVARID